MASIDFEKEKGAFKEWYRTNIDVLHKAENVFRVLIESLLSATPHFEAPVVTSRVKECDEAIRKFSLKYQSALEENGKAYEIKDYITDLVGIRVTCFYEDDIPKIQQLLLKNFKVEGVTDKGARAESDADRFGYKGLHLDLRLEHTRRNLPEYHHIQTIRIEVQVRTIVQHAWSELDHKIAYKRSIPNVLKHRIRSLAALFELADREFVAIKQETEALTEKAQSDEAKAKRSASEAAALPLDAFHALAGMQKRFPKYNFIGSYVDGFVTELLEVVRELKVGEFEKAFDKHLPTIQKYARYIYEERSRRLNPFTMTRHVLYLSDTQAFFSLLFDLQRETFDTWLKARK